MNRKEEILKYLARMSLCLSENIKHTLNDLKYYQNDNYKVLGLIEKLRILIVDKQINSEIIEIIKGSNKNE